MKPKYVFIIALGLTLCSVSSLLTAQEQRPSQPSERIAELAIQEGIPLEHAIDLVQSALKNEPPINVVYAAGVGRRTVPALTLRNVSAADALMLIAAAANVNIDPIRGLEDERIIGFRLTPRLPWPNELPGQPVNGHHPTEGSPASGRPGHSEPYGVAHGDPFGSGGAVLGYGGGIGDYGGLRGYVARGPQPAPRSTRIYPLAEVATTIKFNDLEETVKELLKASDISAKDTHLAFHEKTGVLAVTAPDEVQKLVRDLLQAMATNNRQTQMKHDASEHARHQSELNLFGLEGERLQKKLQETEALVRKYEEEIRRLKEAEVDQKKK